MSKAEELASQSERVADSRLEDDAYEWSVEADVQLRMCAAELRRLAQVERELEALKKAVKDVLSHVEGDLPTRGWLRDNDMSRAAIGSLKHAIKDAK